MHTCIQNKEDLGHLQIPYVVIMNGQARIIPHFAP